MSDVVTAAVDITTRGAGLGLVGGLIVTAVAVSAILLVRNMNSRIRRLPDDFDGPSGAAGAAADQDGPVSPR
jgi:hypothetical protein